MIAVAVSANSHELCLFLSLLVFFCLLDFPLLTTVHAQRFDCSSYTADTPCVNRPSFRIKVLVHGGKADAFWQLMQYGMEQAARDLQVQLDMELYDAFNPYLMVNDITAIQETIQTEDNKKQQRLETRTTTTIDALVLTVPDSSVQAAVGTLIRETEDSLPVFGLNSGADIAFGLGILDFVAMDEQLGGAAAAQYIVDHQSSLSILLEKEDKGLFINPEAGNIALEQRYMGFRSILAEYNITKLEVDGTSPTAMDAVMRDALKGCPYKFIQLSANGPLQAVINAMVANSCPFQSTIIGCFDTSALVWDALSENLLTFTISQQTYLQASAPIVMAALYATTGQRFMIPGDNPAGIYLSGPKVIDRQTLPTPAEQLCAAEGFPICPNTISAFQTPIQCPCTDRSQIVLAGVTHGTTVDPFWDDVYAGMKQSANDFNVTLLSTRLEPQDNLMETMVRQIQTYCGQTNPKISGLFVSLTNELVVQAVNSSCIAQNIPVISINSGESAAKQIGVLNHVGESEFRAGREAGKKMLEDYNITKALCISHEENNVGHQQRCEGLADFFQTSTNTVRLGTIYVSPDETLESYSAKVETAVLSGGMDSSNGGTISTNGSSSSSSAAANQLDSSLAAWKGVGILVMGVVQLPRVFAVQEQHPEIKIGTFDTGPEVSDALAKGHLLFGIDQNAYLQGYWPIPLLSWYVTSQQNLVNPLLETGPRFVTEPPSAEEQICAKALFNTCENSLDSTTGNPASSSAEGSSHRRNNVNSILLILLSSVLVILVGNHF